MIKVDKGGKIMKQVTLKLTGLACPSCMAKIQKALNKQAGVSAVKVLFNASKVKAMIDESQTTAENLGAVVNELGYQVEKIIIK